MEHSSSQYIYPSRCSVRKGFLRNFAKFTEKICSRVSFFIKLQAEVCNFIKKETLPQVYFSEFCKISKNIFFTDHHKVAASVTTPLYFNNTPVRNRLQSSLYRNHLL